MGDSHYDYVSWGGGRIGTEKMCRIFIFLGPCKKSLLAKEDIVCWSIPCDGPLISYFLMPGFEP
jgi:hypothetical protein